MRRAAALIVGGGPAGSAAAIGLARGGLKPLLLERDRETGDALCGGFLSWRTLDALRKLGADPDRLGGARVEHLRIFAGDAFAEASLPRSAAGLSRAALDGALLRLAEKDGACVERGVRVAEATPDRIARLADSGEIEAEALLLATGKHELRGLARPADAAGGDPALGLRVRLAAAPPLTRLVGGAIELHLFDRGYAGLVLHEDGSANLCLALRKSRLTQAGGKPLRLLEQLGRECAPLGERLAWLGGEPGVDAVASVPYGWRAAATPPGVFRLGDQAGVIASLAGEGIGIALATGKAAAAALLRHGPVGAEAFQRRTAARLARPIMVASLLRAIGERPALARSVTRMVGRARGLAVLAAQLTRVDLSY